MRTTFNACTAFFALVLLLFLAGCKKEDEKPVNSFTYNGKTHEVRFAGISEFGPADFKTFDEDYTHYGYFLAFSDGDFNVTGDQPFEAAYFMTMVVYVPFVSMDHEFTGGSFTYTDYPDVFEEQFEKKYFYTFSEILYDRDEDGILDEFDEEEDLFIEIHEGNLDISGSGKNFTFNFNFKDENGKSLVGNYSGEVFYEEYE